MNPPIPSTGKRVDKSIDIAAPVSAVWNALTDAHELTRWFPLDAKIEPGAQGRIFMSWGAGCEGWAGISVWEPNKRLQMSEPREPVPLTTDFILEPLPGNATRLRIVTAGFSDNPGWEAEYNSINEGWRFEMAGLRHYLEHHKGEQRDVIWIQRATQTPRNKAFPAVLAELSSNAGFPAEGEPFSFRAPDGETLQGRVLIHNPPIQLAAVIQNHNNALLRIEMSTVSPKSQTLHAWLWLSTYALPAATRERIRASWEAIADRAMPNA